MKTEAAKKTNANDTTEANAQQIEDIRTCEIVRCRPTVYAAVCVRGGLTLEFHVRNALVLRAPNARAHNDGRGTHVSGSRLEARAFASRAASKPIDVTRVSGTSLRRVHRDSTACQSSAYRVSPPGWAREGAY